MPLEVRSPYDKRIVCTLDYDDGAALERKIASARAAFERWRRVPLAERIPIVEEGLRRLRERAEQVARDVTLQMGKPIVQARGELSTLFDRASYMISIAEDALAADVLPEKPGFHRRIEHEPLGVVLDIAAWNYPLIIPINVILPALLAGNSVLIKHSAKTPLCGAAFEDAFGALEVPDLVKNLILTHDATALLIRDPRVAHVAFTGSVEGGSRVYRCASERFIDVGLELGGKDPAYVAEDADLDFAAAGIVDGACYNAGQSCCAVERAYVHRSVYDAFLEKAAGAMRGYCLGDPLDESTSLGPLVSAAAIETLEAQVRDALARGARLLCGGKRVPELSGHFFAPTLLADVPNDALVMQFESFGPILPVLAVADDDEALEKMADTRFGLTASVWTRSRERAERFASALDAGTIFQNRCDYLDPALPWTGVRDSGLGSTLSRYGFWQLTRRKSIHFRAGD